MTLVENFEESKELTKQKIQKKTVSLVLGSGGARGMAHIGVIRWLEENDFEIKSISGCSIGALVGGIYGAGKLDQFEEWMVSLTSFDVAMLLDFSWESGGVFKGDKIIDTLAGFLEDIKIEDLPLSYTAVATDLTTEKEVWINSGSLFKAIRASVSLPLFFTPVYKGNAILIDGGILNPLPIAPTFNDNTDLTIAVNLGGIPERVPNVPKTSIYENRRSKESRIDIDAFIKMFTSTDYKQDPKIMSIYEVADKAFDAMQNTISRFKNASYPPNVEIVIARDTCGTLELERSAEMIQLGYRKTYLTSQLFNKA